ncbi:molybdopterin-dependent oxidoreductase [Sphingobium sp. HBC34]|uniref:Molybdopterin-dependent oxidoreductase n=1 Tax=Sphingobium cyanobacteriorum TaxID=3063954 RepID=A0ABT8ZHL3_9SPHN|nr:molybdopterin-dependent oxidoreductase [Sphingobium sp. HBC34]MDO7833691.1 molybdopterin-dependent oxidoreductase [Sphingobium sp. HBC34]
MMASKQIKTYCRICNSACGLIADVDGDTVLSVRGERDHPLSGGYSCHKGRLLPEFHRSPDRLLAPLVRRAGRQVETGWDDMLDDLAGKLKAIIAESGPQAIGFFIGAGAFFDGLLYLTARGAAATMGTPQAYSDQTIDSIPKSIAGELVAGSPMALTQPDFDRCRMLIYFGANPLVSHGQATVHSNPTKLLRDVASRADLWVVDPRRTETATKATRHLTARPGSDHAILAFLVREILVEGADHDYIARHTQDVDRLARAAAPFDLAQAARLTGLDPAELTALLAAVRRNGRLAIECGTGVSMSSTGGVVHWLSLALMAITGSLDREGGVWFNPGFHTQAHRRDIPSAPAEGHVRPGPASRPELSSWIGEYPVAAMPDEIDAGHLRALINLSGGLVQCMPETARSKAALARLDVLATLDVVETETTRISTHVLPLKAQFERLDVSMCLDMISPAVATSFTQALVPPPPGVRSGWWVLAQIGKRLGYDLALGIDPDAANDEDFMAHVTAGSPASFAQVKDSGYVQESGATFGWFLDRIDAVGGWRLAPAPLVEQLGALTVRDDPLLMISRRLHHHFNSRVNPDRAEGGIMMNPDDAAGAGLADGAMAIVRSAHGETRGIVRIDATLSRGVMNVPHGFADMNANDLTSSRAVNTLTGMPTFSALPVTVEAV